ncbi:MAG: winged helix-turn-helix domain-containing protein [Candidatus Margulisiibacteriota bacterium]
MNHLITDTVFGSYDTLFGSLTSLVLFDNIFSDMLEVIFGNKVSERILFSLLTQKEVYARNISSRFGLRLQSVQDQFKRLEKGGLLVSKIKGKTRLYYFNPRYALLDEVKELLEKAFSFLPEKDREKGYNLRLRPRRTGKPLW